MNNTTRVLIAFAAGAAIGCVTGILTAPNSGSTTRRKIRRKGEKIVSEVQDKINESQEKLADLKVEVLKAVKEKVEQFN